MSTESLFGGVDLETTLNSESIDLLNAFLTDTVGGSVTLGSFDGSTLLVSSGDSAEKQGVLLPDDSDELQGTMNDGVIRLDLQLPEDVGFMFEGEDNITPTAVDTYLREIIETYLPVGENDYLRNALLNAVTDIIDTMEGLGATVAVRFVEFLSADGTTIAGAVPNGAAAAVGASTEAIFDAAGTGAETVFAFNMANLSDINTLVLRNVNNAAIVGSGQVRVDGTTGAVLTSDSASQSLTGGDGNDTLIGGGGSDTLTGGAGSDVFGFDFAHLGNYTVTDFNLASDKIAIDMANVTDIGALLGAMRAVQETSSGVTFYFDGNVSVTLVGISAEQLTASMVQFDI